MNLFFHFPEAFDEDKRLITSFKEIIVYARKNPDACIYYSESNLNTYKNLNQEIGFYLTDDLKVIRQFLSRAIKIVRPYSPISYNRWHFKKFEVKPCEESVTAIAEKLYADPNYNHILLNLDGEIDTCRNKVLVFRDQIPSTYPDSFVKIDYVTNSTEFVEWFKTHSIKGFSLKDEHKFQKRSEITIKGATVYFETENKRYWHLDTFHDYIEYEVYDSDGIHIATANEKGEINFGGKKNNRLIKSL